VQAGRRDDAGEDVPGLVTVPAATRDDDVIGSVPWHRRLSIKLLALFAAALVAVTAANVWMSRASFSDVEKAVAGESASRIDAVKREVSQELQQSGEAVINHAAHELFYRQLAYLHGNPRSRGIRDARALARFCIGDVGYQRLINRKFMEYGYSNAFVLSGPSLLVVAHGRKDLVGKDFYAVSASLSPEERRTERSDVFEEHWKDRRTDGFYYDQSATFRPSDIPAGMTQKYAYEIWGDFNGIPMMVEVNTYIDEFRRSIRQIEREQQDAASRVTDVARDTTRRHARELIGVSFLLLVLTLAAILALTRSMVERPISAIVEGLKAYGGGDLSAPIRTGADNELRAIEEMSNIMASRLALAMSGLKELNATLEQRVESRTKELSEATDALRLEKEQSEALLRNVLPRKIAERLKGRPAGIMVEDYAQVSVLFTDFKGFTSVAETVTPERLIRELNEIFGRFDELAEEHGMEKIKTIGDSYFAVGGLPERNGTHPEDAVKLALAMRDYVEERLRSPDSLRLSVRIGVHSGPVIAGIIGRSKFAYDLWGDTVNIASRMESAGAPGKVNVSEATYNLVKDRFTFVARGKLPVKGKGEVAMYFVEPRTV
jgi:class 3 adenylate cyclase/HAMP domain-containing protein